jgi:hypothetical protein
MKIDSEVKSLFKKVRVKLGAPIRNVQLEDDQLCELLEMCVEDYAKLVQNWLIENQWSSVYGKDVTTTDMAFAMSVRTFDYLKDYSYWFSKEVGLQQRGPWELKKDFITVETGKQSYMLPAGREINKVLYMTPPTTQTAVMGNYGGMTAGLGYGGMPQVGGGYGASSGPMGGYFIAPAYDTMLLAADLQMKQRLLRSDLVYKVTGGPEGTKILHLLSTPGSKLSFGYPYGSNGSIFGVGGSKVWYTYYDVEGKNVNKCRKMNPDILLTPDKVPLDKMDYGLMNEPTKVTIRQLLIAESKILLGNIRGYASGKIMIPDSELTLDYAMLHEQGKAEKEEVIKELMERLIRMSPQAQLETMAKMAQSMTEIKKTQPVPGWIIV